MFPPTTSLTALELQSEIVRDPLTVSPTMTVMAAIAQMDGVRSLSPVLDTDNERLERYLKARASCVVVVEAGQVVGILTERDILRLTAQQQPLASLPIGQVMTHPVVTLPIAALADFFAALQLFQQHHIQHLPLLDEQNHLVGLVTQTSLLQALNPLKLYNLVQGLETKISHLEAKKVALMELCTVELEHQVEARMVELKAKADREKLLADIATRIRASLSLQTLLDTTVTQIRQLLGCDRVNIWQLSAAGEAVAVAESTDSPLSLIGERICDTFFQQHQAESYRLGQVRVIQDIYTTEMADCHRQLLVSLQTRAKILVPLLCGDRLWGLLNATEGQHPRNWQPEEVELLQALSVQLAIALQQVTTHQQLQEELEARKQVEARLQEDIRERQRSETALQKNEAHQRALMRALPDLIMRVNQAGIYQEFVATPTFHIVGNLTELVGTHVSETLPPELAQRRLDAIQRALATDSIQVYEQDLSIDGRTQVEEVRVVPYGDDEVLALVRDISETKRREVERQQAELALRQSEAQSRAVLAAIPDLMFRVGADGVYRGYVTNQRQFDLVSQAIDPTGRSLIDVLPPEIAERELYYLQKALQTGELQVYEQRIQVGDRPQDEEVRVIKSGDDEVLFMIRDITERKRAEAALQLSEQTNRTIIETMPDLLIQMDREGRYTRMVGGHSVCVHYPCKNSTQPELHDVLPPELAQQRLYYANQALVTGELQVYEQVLNFDNDQHYEEVRVAPLNEHEVLIIIRDITERKQAEAERLQANKDRLELKLLEKILDIVLAGYWDWDIPNQQEYLSPGFKRMFGYADHELPNRPETWQNLIFPEDLPKMLECFDRHVQSQGKVPYYHEVRYRHKDGSTVWVSCSGQVIEWDEAGQPLRMIGCHIDISERARLEAERKHMEAELAESEAKFRRLVEGSNDLVWSMDCNAVFTYLSPQFQTIFGWDANDWIGQVSLELVHPDDRLFVSNKPQEMLQAGKSSSSIEFRHLHRDGHYIWVRSSTTVVKNAAGELIGLQGSLSDISDLKQTEFALQASENRFREVFTSNIVGMMFTDFSGQIIDANDRLLGMLGYTRADLDAGRINWVNLTPTEHAVKDRQAMEHLERYRAIDPWEKEYYRKDGSRVPVLVGVALLSEIDSSCVCVVMDISDLKRVEAQLQRTNEQLARATRLKDEFLANMSHELRTPLNAVLGMTEGLQDQIYGKLNDSQLRALQTIERSGAHLLELINDILDLAKIESGQIELNCTPTAIAPLCQSSLTFIKQQALKKRIQLEINLPPNLPDLLVDERRLRQVLINLLNNAVKFTPDGGYITLEVTDEKQVMDPTPLQGITRVKINRSLTDERINDVLPLTQPSEVIDPVTRNYLRIAVRDTGIGIAPEHISKLFQPFVQIDSALNRQYSGTGLGLALVKRIVELHGGQVGLTSQVGYGSCFTIDLPYTLAVSAVLEPAPVSTINPAVGQAEPHDLPVILLAEDNEANVSVIANYLSAKGYHMLVANDGKEAISLSQSIHPDLILMDIQMPGVDGLEAIRQIRRLPNLANTPIIALTALAMEGDRERCLTAGANDYLSKPVRLKELVEMMQQWLVVVEGTA